MPISSQKSNMALKSMAKYQPLLYESTNSTKPSFKNTTPTKSLHKELNKLLVEDIYKLSVLKFIYKQLNNLPPNIFNQFYIENESIHSHNTRQSHGLHVINPTNKFCQRRIIYQGTFIWNSIPAQLRPFHFKTFSKKVKQNIISKY